jgi:hypothetical protein
VCSKNQSQKGRHVATIGQPHGWDDASRMLALLATWYTRRDTSTCPNLGVMPMAMQCPLSQRAAATAGGDDKPPAPPSDAVPE